jgi:hypothetical protein
MHPYTPQRDPTNYQITMKKLDHRLRPYSPSDGRHCERGSPPQHFLAQRRLREVNYDKQAFAQEKTLLTGVQLLRLRRIRQLEE